MKNIQDFYPLSPMQQGMLFHSRLAPDSGVYVEQLSCQLDGSLDPAAFEQAWQQAAERHTILRTAFIGEGLKEPVQAVYRQVAVTIQQEDWSELPAERQAARLSEVLARERARGFDLSQAPLFRLALFRLGASTWRFVWSYHHILLDGWSMPILLNDVFSAYLAIVHGQTLVLPPPRPFRDYIAWLRRQDAQAAQTYWRANLAGFLAPTRLPEDWAAERAPEGEPIFAEVEQWLSEDDTARLKAFARAQHLTLGTLVQAAWAVVLGLHAGEDDVVFGATVSGRPADLPDSDGMVGLLINTLPVRVKLPPEATVAEWLSELQARLGEMRQYEYCSLVDIQGWSEVPRGQPLFESLLVYENYPIQNRLEGAELGLRLADVHSSEQTNYPLNLIAGAAERLMVKIVYDTGRSMASGAMRLVSQVVQVLSAFVTQPQDRLGELVCIPDQEKVLILGEWNRVETDYDLERPVTALFERQADRAPGACALVFEDRSLTYAELDATTNQLARWLSRQGVGPETLVAVCLEPGLELVIALLGILKAGGAYLPLDPTYPTQRLAYMLEDSRATLLLTQHDLAAALPAPQGRVVCLDTQWEPVSRESATRLACPAGPGNLAYLIYTSGSTGRPKGVLLQHRGLANLVQALIPIFDVRPESRLLQFASICFDASVSEIFTALAAGAALVLARREVRTAAPLLSRLINEQGVTIATFPPSLLGLLDPREHPGLLTVVSAGEACPLEVARRWSPGRRMINGYGPTETTVAALYDVIDGLPQGALGVPIGRPIPNTQVYVLNAAQKPVPLGAPGELCVSGISLARGYLNRPELTAAKFIPNPFSPEPGARLYRTGDRVRWRPDARLEFLGRLDDQVKLRGFRIELGEIETVLSQHPDLLAAVAAVRPAPLDGALDAQTLAAYVVPRPGARPDLAEVRAFLKPRLPDFMLPNALVCLEALPTLPNGKVDRRRLPVPDQVVETPREIIAPRDLLEARLSQVWEQVLNRHPISVRDNFFDLGGHSLLAVRLAASVKERLGWDLGLADFYQGATIEQMAARMRQPATPGRQPLLVPIQPSGSRPALVFIHPSGGSVHWYTDLAGALGRDQPFYGIQMQGLLSDEPLHTHIEAMAAAYLAELRAFQPQGPYALGSWSMGVTVAYEMACQLVEQGQAVALLAMLDQGPRLPASEPQDDAEYLVQVFGAHVGLTVGELRALPAEQQIGEVWERARRAHFIYPEVSLEQFTRFIQTLRTHTEAWRQYRPRPYPGKLVLLRAADQVHEDPRPDLGWAELALGGVEVRTVPGDHLTMIHPPHVEALAQEIGACLEKASAEGSTATPPPAADGQWAGNAARMDRSAG